MSSEYPNVISEEDSENEFENLTEMIKKELITTPQLNLLQQLQSQSNKHLTFDDLIHSQERSNRNRLNNNFTIIQEIEEFYNKNNEINETDEYSQFAFDETRFHRLHPLINLIFSPLFFTPIINETRI